MAELAILIPIFALMIPISAIIAPHLMRAYELSLKHKNAAGIEEIAEMRRKLEEMEQRVLTLQDLVIGGEFQARRNLASREPDRIPPAPATSPAAQATESTLHNLNG